MLDGVSDEVMVGSMMADAEKMLDDVDLGKLMLT